MKKRILFISHDASLTGGPILLLRLIVSLSRNSDYVISILLKKRGILKNDFGRYGDVFVWNEQNNKNFLIAFFQKIIFRFQKWKFLSKINSYDIIFNNTITNADLLRDLPLTNKLVFNYWHEMGVLTKQHTTKSDIEFMNSISEKIFVPAEAVKQMFVNKYNISSNKIELLKYIIPQVNNDIKSSKSSGNSKFVVGIVGTLYWRKGYDLLPLIAKEIYHHLGGNDVSFIWLGADKKLLEYSILISDLEKLKLMEHFTFVEPTLDISKYWSALDVLLLPSREDAFPLVVMEAASHGVPSICFRDAGGISEFVEDDAGILIDYLDIQGMANSIIKLKNNTDFRDQLGKAAKEKIGFYSEIEILNQFNKHIS